MLVTIKYPYLQIEQGKISVLLSEIFKALFIENKSQFANLNFE